MEMWKVIEGFNGRYEVSNLGRIKSLFGTEKILKPCLNSAGYSQYSLNMYGKVTRFLVHRLVATYFVSNPFNYPQVNHLDSNPANNAASNLEWCSASLNQLHANEYGNRKVGSGCYLAKISESDVREILSLKNKFGKTAIARQMNVSYSTVNKIFRGESWRHITGLPKKHYPSMVPKFSQNTALKGAA